MGGKKQNGKQREEQLDSEEQAKDKVRKPSSTDSDLAVLNIISDSNASLGSSHKMP